MDKISEIASVLAKTNDALLIQEFLYSILTPKETQDLSSRWELVKLLDDGMSQRNIARELHLSLCKITRGSKELRKENSALKQLIEIAKK
jgi:TrpR family trp operon transcriptional repressor